MQSRKKALLISELGINPQNDGKVIRLVFPQLTEERRKELTKQVKKYGESGKVAIRNIRRDAMETFKKKQKASELTEDDQKKLLADSVMPAYRQFRSWAEEFEDASLETKKMIACQLFSRVEVGKGYKIKVIMNMTYRQFVSEWGGENMMMV